MRGYWYTQHWPAKGEPKPGACRVKIKKITVYLAVTIYEQGAERYRTGASMTWRPPR